MTQGSLSYEDMDIMAGEYAIGLLEGDAAAQAQALLEGDATFARLVENWRERLSVLDMTASPQPASAQLWGRIEASLDTAPDTPLEATAAASRARPGRAAPSPGPGSWINVLWSNIGFWRPAGLIAGLASLVLALGLGFTMREVGRQPVLVAVLMTDANQPGAVVNVHADGRAELVPLGDIAVPAGRVLQIWTLWDKVRGPVSVGLAQSARRLDLNIKSLPRAVPSQLFEITLEPEGGSPTGRPTGPILMKGNATTAL